MIHRYAEGLENPRMIAVADGDSPHRYHFQIFALDTTLDLPSGFNRHALLKAMEGHVIAKGTLVGTFAKAP